MMKNDAAPVIEALCGNCDAFFPIPNHPNKAGTCRRRAPVPLVQRYIAANHTDLASQHVTQILNGLVDGFFAPTVPTLTCKEFFPAAAGDAAIFDEVDQGVSH